MYSVVKHINSLYRAREEFLAEAEKAHTWLLDCRQEYMRLAKENRQWPMYKSCTPRKLPFPNRMRLP